MKRVVLVILIALVLGFSTFANATLIDNGNGLIYDTDLNITWYDYSCPPFSTWDQAMDWASGLTAGGVTGWRLPRAVDAPHVFGYNGTTTGGYNVTTSEMSHLV